MTIKITADSTADLSPLQIKAHNIDILPLYVTLGDETRRDGVDIFPRDIYASVASGGAMAATAAVTPHDYGQCFGKYAAQYDAVVHINIGSRFSACYQNALIAAEEYENVYVVDSCNLSTGHGHVVMEAAERAESGMGVKELLAELTDIIPRVDASFILGTLEYMRKGGRCSSVAALGANMLGLKPCIEVVDGAMRVGTKYRGAFDKAMQRYIRERIGDGKDIERHRLFVTHSGVSDEIEALAVETARKCADFGEVIATKAGCTVSSHCGPDCLGVLYIRK